MNFLINRDELLNSSTLSHVHQSESLILEGSKNCDSGNVLILGGGKCTEIPILDLLQKHESIDIVELKYDSLFL